MVATIRIKYAFLVALKSLYFSIIPSWSATSEETGCPTRLDLAIIMDDSGSITFNPDEDNFSIMKQFIKNLTQVYPIGIDDTRIGLIKFSTKAKMMFNFDSYISKLELLNAIDSLQHEGGLTNIAAAMNVMTETLFGEESQERLAMKNVAILITDGKDTADSHKLSYEIKKAVKADIEIFAVGVSPSIDSEQLKMIVSKPVDSHLYLVEDFSSLENILNDLIDNTCCRKPIDIGLVIDSSGSITDKGEDNFQLVLGFMSNIVKQFKISQNYARIAAINFSNLIRLEWPLLMYQTEEEVVDAILNIKNIGGDTNLTGALRVMREQVLKYSDGDREDAANVVIVITDGYGTMDVNSTDIEINLLKKKATVIVIGVTSDTNKEELKRLATNTNYIFQAETFTSILPLVSAISSSVCNAPYIT